MESEMVAYVILVRNFPVAEQRGYVVLFLVASKLGFGGRIADDRLSIWSNETNAKADPSGSWLHLQYYEIPRYYNFSVHVVAQLACGGVCI